MAHLFLYRMKNKTMMTMRTTPKKRTMGTMKRGLEVAGAGVGAEVEEICPAGTGPELEEICPNIKSYIFHSLCYFTKKWQKWLGWKWFFISSLIKLTCSPAQRFNKIDRRFWFSCNGLHNTS